MHGDHIQLHEKNQWAQNKATVSCMSRARCLCSLSLLVSLAAFAPLLADREWFVVWLLGGAGENGDSPRAGWILATDAAAAAAATGGHGFGV